MNDLLNLTHIAHRGLHQENYPNPSIRENSKSAFLEAINQQFPIECDIQITQDNVPVIFHDSSLMRMIGIDRNINQVTLRELKSFNLINSADQVLTLAEFLQLVDGQVYVVLEVKNDTPNQAVVDYLIPILKQYSHPYAIHSFNWRTLQLLKQELPHIPCGKLIKKFNIFIYLYNHLFSKFIEEDFISVKVDDYPIHPADQNYPKPILTWTVNTADKLVKAQSFADTFIFENFPTRKD